MEILKQAPQTGNEIHGISPQITVNLDQVEYCTQDYIQMIQFMRYAKAECDPSAKFRQYKESLKKKSAD